MKKRLAFGVLSIALLAGSAAGAAPAIISTTGQTHGWVLHAKPYDVTGYRDARFGMDLAAVKAAIAKDFPGAALTEKDNPVDRTQLASVTVPMLAPGPGAATVSYVFGAASHRLAQVNLVWAGAKADALTAAAGAAESDFMGYQWQPLTEVLGAVLDGGGLIVFAASDAKGAGVEIRLEGVPFDYTQGGKKQHFTPGAGAPFLRVAYSSDVQHPDEYKIKPGEF